VWKELNYGKMSEKEKQMIVSEVNILRELRHPNIVKYYDRIIDKEQSKIYIVMEYCEGGDISKMIKNCKKEKTFIPEEIIWSILAQMIAALGVCHNRKEGKILH
jgi:NIMA (never in mitosis gene a)-related kinase